MTRKGPTDYWQIVSSFKASIVWISLVYFFKELYLIDTCIAFIFSFFIHSICNPHEVLSDNTQQDRELLRSLLLMWQTGKKKK